MMLWTLFALMIAAALLAVLWPLRRAKIADATPPGSGDVAVYRDQLEEVERDREAGTIGAAEAEAARIEVARRLIGAAQAQTAAGPRTTGDPPPRRRRVAALFIIVGLPLGAVALYLVIGSPSLPGQPLAARTMPARGVDRSVEALIARVEAHLAEHPEDGRGWEVIAPVYLRLGRFDDAVKARANALRLLGETAERSADLGEALVAAASGVVTADAKAAFDQAVRLDPTNVMARFYLGLAAEQDGDRMAAARIWRALLADAPEGARWPEFVRKALARVESPAAPGPDAVAPPAVANDAIRGMVERLAARLRKDGSDVEGWIQLVRSYKVLGEGDRVKDVISDARRALAGDPDKLRRLEDGIKSLGVEG
jgi:cytochrome c-type biogenesis protein CcmH